MLISDAIPQILDLDVVIGKLQSLKSTILESIIDLENCSSIEWVELDRQLGITNTLKLVMRFLGKSLIEADRFLTGLSK